MDTDELKLCLKCGYEGAAWQFEEHHPDRKSRPKFTVTLCIPCHRGETRRERRVANPKDVRFELRCKGEDVAMWRAAAGDVPLARWIRNVANEAAALGCELATPLEPQVAEQTVRFQTGPPSKSFRPDFKGKR